MQEGYICKDCNYTSDTAGNCPYCDMPMEPIDGVDETTGEPSKYKEEEIKEVEKENLNNTNMSNKEVLAKDELDEIIES